MNLFSRLVFGALLLGASVWLTRSRRERVRRFAALQLLEGPAQGKRYAQLASELQQSGEHLQRRLKRVHPGEANAGTLRHIIGIERWGQRRLAVALGEPFQWDEHQAYLPPRSSSVEELRREFAITRAATVTLAQSLSESPPEADWRVAHNSLGPLSARGWLRYLQLHADIESRRLRRGRARSGQGV